ncbi:MAG: LysM peptidoglycan-binding domain-containing protein [Rothia sp. (in: high G+C Gram-positive bacteria)]|uniref:LysM peptidoglycan-binding domain-containing protein n=1 Tax=Rothia sp. (in: high G+C Gram-positive bacteria) TaxID=1885016 RepID=UPI0026DFA00B|nr:LysM peptidoglycan-binding domain-containing protein [Rothia sp. (in: high G+C Gram-positive bacteria)]MDO5751194.1 LysM peptidoglycan-binding domain-containing protein [Rothia sp. (in: high G+C Gram-positive bacteria)]
MTTQVHSLQHSTIPAGLQVISPARAARSSVSPRPAVPARTQPLKSASAAPIAASSLPSPFKRVQQVAVAREDAQRVAPKPARAAGLSARLSCAFKPVRGAWSRTREYLAAHRAIRLGVPALAVALLLLVGGFALGASTRAQADGTEHEATTRVITVRAGQSLWDIARDVDSQRDTREVVHQIERMNNVSASNLRAGQRLEVPITR